MCLQSCFSPGVLGSVCSYTEPSCEDPAESKAGLLRLQGALKQTQGFEASESLGSSTHSHTNTYYVHTPPEPQPPSSLPPKSSLPPAPGCRSTLTPKAKATSKIMPVISVPKFGIFVERALQLRAWAFPTHLKEPSVS